LSKLDDQAEEIKRIDHTLADWRQGDLVRKERWFIHAGPSPDVQAIKCEVEGLVILTQSCDIVRSCAKRPYLEVAPLVEVAAEALPEIEKGLRPAYAYLPAVADARLVADLDRVMTVEKSVVATWEKTRGCNTDDQVRRFAEALARKRSRFAFPDDFTDLVSKLQLRIREKHDKHTEEGNALRALSEIRVSADPSWDEPVGVELFFWFIRKGEEPIIPSGIWTARLDSWKKLIPPKGRFNRVEGQIVSLEDITALDYLGSERLDLDYLSGQED